MMKGTIKHTAAGTVKCAGPCTVKHAMGRLAVILSLLLWTSIALAAQGQMQPLVNDTANLLSAEQRQALEEKLEKIGGEYGAAVGVLTMEKLPSGISLEKFAHQYLNQNYSNPENSKGAILFVQVTGTRDFWVATDNQIVNIITNEHGYPYLEEHFLDSMKADNYYQAYNQYADAVEELCRYYEEEGEAYDPTKEFSFGALLLGLLVSAGIGYCFYGYLVGRMSNVAPQTAAGEYLDKNSLHLTEREDIFMYTTRSVVHHERKNDSGSSGSGSSDSGGGGGGKY